MTKEEIEELLDRHPDGRKLVALMDIVESRLGASESFRELCNALDSATACDALIYICNMWDLLLPDNEPPEEEDE